tara:strand:- start:10207 stop:10653 length:447 start_codon:yes stop_codon:yes gene_type:complete
MSAKDVSELPDNYEIVILADGTQIPRERQTKAQARIQALIAKSRYEKLRQQLILLSDKTNKRVDFKIPEENTQSDKKEINHQITVAKNERSAIERQMELSTEKTVVRHEPSNSNKKDQGNLADSKTSNLKKRILGPLINKKIAQLLKK